MPDRLIRALLEPPRVRACAVVTTETVREAVRRHELDSLGAVLLGRSLTAGLLLATLTKGDERVSLQITGDGPVSLVTVDAVGAGDVRGYLSRRAEAQPALGTQRRPSVAQALGRGTVQVLRDLGLREEYRGSASTVTSEIDEDVEAYLRQSEQLDSALGCEVALDPNGQVAHAGGLLVQAMPGGEPELIRAVQHGLRTGRLYAALAGGNAPTTPLELARSVLDDLPLRVLDERPVQFACRCSPERAHGILAMLDADELTDMIDREGKAEITCNFCSARYLFSRGALEKIRAEADSVPRERN
jgi:molecular chaperone Hsp33